MLPQSSFTSQLKGGDNEKGDIPRFHVEDSGKPTNETTNPSNNIKTTEQHHQPANADQSKSTLLFPPDASITDPARPTEHVFQHDSHLNNPITLAQ